MNRRTDRLQKAPGLLTSPNALSFYAIFLMWALCALFYYFGELVDFANWEALQWDFFRSVHDVHRLLFLAPIIYAAYIFGVRATVIITIISLMTFLPRALFISPYPDSLARMLVFIVFAGILGYLTAITRNEARKALEIKSLLSNERDRLLGILERMQDGVLITGPDYKIRYMNAGIRREFGEGGGPHCYQLLKRLDAPCGESCKMPLVLGGNEQEWTYRLADGRTYEVLASPYIDSDGTVCQLTTFRKTSEQEGAAAGQEANSS